MGIGVQELQFLSRCSQEKEFGKTLTIGRQGVHVFPHQGNYFLGIDNFVKNDFCEDMFTSYFGSTIVQSMDYSNYEGATIIHDLNKPIDIASHEYDTIFDGGSLEHIYNIPEAFKSLSKMCKVGGQILHSLPLNNNSGHGFWQMTPELFFSLYSEKNGYSDTKVYIGSTEDPNWLFEVQPPENGERLDIQVFLYEQKQYRPLYAFVKTTLVREDFSHDRVMQSDYDYIWKDVVKKKSLEKL